MTKSTDVFRRSLYLIRIPFLLFSCIKQCFLNLLSIFCPRCRPSILCMSSQKKKKERNERMCIEKAKYTFFSCSMNLECCSSIASVNHRCPPLLCHSFQPSSNFNAERAFILYATNARSREPIWHIVKSRK